ncbi:MAG TPA: Hsp20 family protein [Gemmatimonadales bacterium]|nr:Hsp20 family protein [Gemmatimonadales bacterium]
MKEQSTAVEQARQAPPLRLVSTEQMFDRMKETFDAIARRAFDIFERNGRRFGRDLDDWFQAEAEVLHPLHLEISEAEGALTVRAEIPGFTEKDIQVNVEPRRLTISGKRESTEERKTGKTVYSERCSNEIFRAVELPAEVDTAAGIIKAIYDRGMLTITLPKVKKARRREIKLEPTAGKD